MSDLSWVTDKRTGHQYAVGPAYIAANREHLTVHKDHPVAKPNGNRIEPKIHVQHKGVKSPATKATEAKEATE